MSNLLPSLGLSCRLRALLFNTLGNRIAYSARLESGGYVYGSRLTVGRRCFIGRNVYFDLSDTVVIEDDVVVGHGAVFVTANHEIGPPERRAGPVAPAPILIGRGVWIAANATIMPGVTIGAGAVVAANSLVRTDVAPNMLVAGVPAKVIRALDIGA